VCTVFVFWFHILLKHTATSLLHHPCYIVQHRDREYFKVQASYFCSVFDSCSVCPWCINSFLICRFFEFCCNFCVNLFSFFFHKGFFSDFEHSFSFSNRQPQLSQYLTKPNQSKSNEKHLLLIFRFHFIRNGFFLFLCLRRKGQFIWRELTCLSISG